MKPLRDYQIRGIEMIGDEIRSGHRSVCFVAPTGCHRAGTEILMFDGSVKPVELVEPGDLLMGPDSSPRAVLDLVRGRANMYRVVPIKGEPFVVNGDHVLTLERTPDGRTPGGGLIDVSVIEWSGWSKTQQHLWKLCRRSVQFPEADQRIDPYFLGVLLGDGCLCTSQISVCKPDPEIEALCRAEAARWGANVRKTGVGTSASWVFCGNSGTLKESLAHYGLHGTRSHDKFVPVEYRIAAWLQRQQVLAGLLDSDGSRTAGGYDFVSKSERLARDVAFLARSLGLAAYVSTCRKGCQSGAVGDYWRVSVSGDCADLPLRIPRKQSPRRHQKKSVLRTGFHVEAIGLIEPYFGFVVDSDHRYLMGDFTVTHNCGKTLTIGEVCRRHVVKVPNAKVIWAAHREELVAQSWDALTGLGLECGVIQSTPVREVNPFRQVQVASIQTLVARNIRLEGITLMIGDECHHAPSKTWADIPAFYRANGAVIIGATATPVRADGIGLGEIYDALVQPITTREAIAQGYLVPFNMFRPPRQLRNDQIAQSPVSEYLVHARGEKAIVFAAHLKAANQFLDEFRAAGIDTVLISGEQETGLRRAAFERYQQGTARVLVNVGIATEGFDDPPTSCVILARAIGSLSLYLQICGRALRLSPSTGKVRASIIDLHGSSHVHGAPDDDRVWSLDGEATPRRTAEELPNQFCKVCSVLVEGGGSICEFCAIARPELVPPTVANVQLVRYAAKLQESTEQRRAYFEKLKIIAATRGHNEWAPRMKYKAIYQEMPPRAWW